MSASDDATLSGTERGKRDKARRIREASRAMFVTKGFENATIRDIARMAEVAQGTLFLYASSKRDLLFMLYNDLIEGALNDCKLMSTSRVSLAEFLVRVAFVHLQRFTEDAAIARLSLVHLNLYDDSREAARFAALHSQMIALIEAEFRLSRDSGALREDFAVDVMTAMTLNVLIEMFKVYVRSNLPDIRKVMQQSHAQILVILRGLGAAHQTMEIAGPDMREWIGLPPEPLQTERRRTAS